MTALLIASLLVAVTEPTQQPRDNHPPGNIGTGSIAGVVISDDDEKRPLRRTRVALASTELDFARVAITNDRGEFTFEALPPGRYSVTASKDGYVTNSAGAQRPERLRSGVYLSQGANERVTLRLPKGAVITGRLLNAEGEPAAAVTVGAMISRYNSNAGERRLTAAPGTSTASTDDRGIYRLFGLPAGDYVIVAQPRGAARASDVAGLRVQSDVDIRAALGEVRAQSTPSRPGIPAAPTPRPAPEPLPQRLVSLASVYFPGTSLAHRAAVVTVRHGEVRTGVDFDLEYVATSTIDGIVSAPPGTGRIALSLANADREAPTEQVRSTSAGTDGRFTFRGVPPGRYVLSARSLPTMARDAAPPVSLWAATELVVQGDDVTGVTLPLQPAATISGRLVFESSGVIAPPRFDTLRLPPLQAANTSFGTFLPMPPIFVEGERFTMPGVIPGTYRFFTPPRGIRTSIGGWWLNSVVLGGKELLDGPTALGEADTNAVITFSDRASELSGTVRYASGSTVTDEWVVVFSRDPRHWFHNSRRVAGIRPTPAGRYSVRNLPAGEYFVAVTNDLEFNEWFDPQALEQLAASAQLIRLDDYETRSHDVSVKR